MFWLLLLTWLDGRRSRRWQPTPMLWPCWRLLQLWRWCPQNDSKRRCHMIRQFQTIYWPVFGILSRHVKTWARLLRFLHRCRRKSHRLRTNSSKNDNLFTLDQFEFLSDRILKILKKSWINFQVLLFIELEIRFFTELKFEIWNDSSKTTAACSFFCRLDVIAPVSDDLRFFLWRVTVSHYDFETLNQKSKLQPLKLEELFTVVEEYHHQSTVHSAYVFFRRAEEHCSVENSHDMFFRCIFDIFQLSPVVMPGCLCARPNLIYIFWGSRLDDKRNIFAWDPFVQSIDIEVTHL